MDKLHKHGQSFGLEKEILEAIEKSLTKKASNLVFSTLSNDDFARKVSFWRPDEMQG